MTSPIDPFATSAKVPAVTFAEQPVGTTFVMKVRGAAEKVQGKDYESQEPAVWKNKDGSTSPKYSAVVPVTMPDGEERAIWAVIPSAMFVALQDALKGAGIKTFGDAIGGELTVKYDGDKVNPDKPRLNPAKQFKAKISLPAPGAASDPFGGDSSAPPW